MIRPAPGVAFTSAAEGDLRDARQISEISSILGISSEWALLTQVHGSDVVHATAPGRLGSADAIVTSESGLPVAVMTADCLGVVGHTADLVGVAHAGWRGLAAGVLTQFRSHMGPGASYFVGPSIGPCCYEVGPEVAATFPDDVAATTWGTPSVDLRSAARRQLRDITWIDERCTHCGDDLHSHRRNGTPERLAAIGWR